MLTATNTLARYVEKINRLPLFMRPFLLTQLFCRQVKFANTTGIDILHVNFEQVQMRLRNRKRVQNHIGGIHAVAAAVLAESCTGLLLGMHVPNTRLPLLKSMTVEFKRRMNGNLHAQANLSAAQIKQISEHEQGDVVVPVIITDDSGEQPIICQMHWAWVVKTRR